MIEAKKNTEKMNYDKIILDCIKSDFKTAREISQQTGINITRVSLRLNQLDRNGFLVRMQKGTQTVIRPGVKPWMYRKSK